jgi:hypothetical protein
MDDLAGAASQPFGRMVSAGQARCGCGHRAEAPGNPKNAGFPALFALTWGIVADTYAQLSAGGEFRLVGTAP